MADTLDALWSSLAPNEAGLVAAVIVHEHDGRVLMLGYMNREALAATLTTRHVTFFSRSKQRLWRKGESSGHVLELVSLRVDCDGDALLIDVSPKGPTCHTGASSCFFTPIELPVVGVAEPVGRGRADDGPSSVRESPIRESDAALERLWQTILERKAGRGMTNRDERSYVRSLLDSGIDTINAKLREEADELCEALASETDERVASEAADLLFHALVGLAARDLEPASVAAVLRSRHGLSGLDEKAARKTSMVSRRR